MSAYFVTAIGTEIGKTYVSACLLKGWRAAGHMVHALKPVMSGFGEDALDISDAGQLLKACGRPVTPQSVSEVCLHRFEAPLAPNVAMRRAGVAQDYEAILSFTRARLQQAGARRMIVEGAGGVMSPLTDDTLQIDFMADLGLPVILVAAPYLGAVSHTLTAVDALRARGIGIDRLIISQPEAGSADPAMLGEEISRFRAVRWQVLGHGSEVFAGSGKTDAAPSP